jgi:hypothetical protein
VSLIERFRFMECIIRETPTNRRRTAAKIRDAHTMNVKNALIAKRLPKRACPMNADLMIVIDHHSVQQIDIVLDCEHKWDSRNSQPLSSSNAVRQSGLSTHHPITLWVRESRFSLGFGWSLLRPISALGVLRIVDRMLFRNCRQQVALSRFVRQYGDRE